MVCRYLISRWGADTMRTELQPFEGKTSLFIATFGKYGTWRSRGIAGRSILLLDLKTGTGRLLADHTWINYTAGFDAAGEFARGEQVRFTAGVKPYCKGYFGQKIGDRFARVPGLDYRLSFPRNVERLGTVQPCDGTLTHKEQDQHPLLGGRTKRAEARV